MKTRYKEKVKTSSKVYNKKDRSENKINLNENKTMKKADEIKYDVGIIVGRFQVDKLHKAHKDIIEHVIDAHKKVILFLGLSPLKCTPNNPLDFETRKKMISKEYPDINILYIKDTHSDMLWSDALDEQIKDLTNPNDTVLLYGGRNSFIDRYHGRHKTCELQQETYVSGTDIRKGISKETKGSIDFRKGVIYGSTNRFFNAIMTVDIGIFDEDGMRILLGRKKDESTYRLLGGFVDSGELLEQAARREVREEAGGIEVSDPQYVMSKVINDWRYKSEKEKITTALFICKIMFGNPKPGDDIHELKWFSIASFKDNNLNNIGSEHRDLLKKLIKYQSSNLIVTKVTK